MRFRRYRRTCQYRGLDLVNWVNVFTFLCDSHNVRFYGRPLYRLWELASRACPLVNEEFTPQWTLTAIGPELAALGVHDGILHG